MLQVLAESVKKDGEAVGYSPGSLLQADVCCLRDVVDGQASAREPIQVCQPACCGSCGSRFQSRQRFRTANPVQSTYSVTRFAVYDTLKEKLADGSSKPTPPWKLALAASVAGAAGGLVGNPADIVLGNHSCDHSITTCTTELVHRCSTNDRRRE